MNEEDYNKIQNAVWRIRPYQVHDIQQEFVRQNKELTRDQLIQLCEDAVKVKSVAILSFFFTDVLFINSDGTRNQQMEQNILKCALKFSFECFHFLLSMGLELKMDNATIFRTLISSKSVCPKMMKYFSDQPDFDFKSIIDHNFLLDIFRRGVGENINIFSLINIGLNVNNVYRRNSCGEPQNILHLAAASLYDEEFLSELLTTGVDMEQMGDGFTPLTLAAKLRNPCLTKVLVNNGCDINRRCANGETALSIAISRSYTESLVRILLEGGADIENYMRESDLASLLEYNQIFFYLILKHGGDMYLNHRDSKGFRLIQRLLKPCYNEIRDETLLYRLIAFNCSLDDLQIPKEENKAFSNTEFTYCKLYSSPKFTYEFKRILYLSGAPKEILHLSHLEFYDDEWGYSDEEDEDDDYEEKMCFGQSLKSLCRRIIRQSMGLGIKTKLEKSSLPRSIQDYILLKDEILAEYFDIPEEKINKTFARYE